MTEISDDRKRRKRRTGSRLEGFSGVTDDRSALDQYLREVSQHELLNAAQEIELGKLAQAGDEDAVARLVRANLRFVISVAKKYQNRGVSLIDLIQEGNVGLVTAARKFDPDQGVKFISYAVWWIRQAILASLANQGRAVRVPLNRASDLARILDGMTDKVFSIGLHCREILATEPFGFFQFEASVTSMTDCSEG